MCVFFHVLSIWLIRLIWWLGQGMEIDLINSRSLPSGVLYWHYGHLFVLLPFAVYIVILSHLMLMSECRNRLCRYLNIAFPSPFQCGSCLGWLQCRPCRLSTELVGRRFGKITWIHHLNNFKNPFNFNDLYYNFKVSVVKKNQKIYNLHYDVVFGEFYGCYRTLCRL